MGMWGSRSKVSCRACASGRENSMATREPAAENAIRSSKRDEREKPAPASDTEQAKKAPRKRAAAPHVPEDVRKRFVQVGAKYFFPDGARAFTDRGHRLTTP